MSPPAERIIHTRLTDDTAVCIRRITPDDGARMRDGIIRLSDRSRYLRFFSVQPMPPPKVIERLLATDGHGHIAWGAIASDLPGEPAIGAVHAIANPEVPERAEFSVAVVDDFHDRGVGRLLTATILLDAARQGYAEFQALTLAENASATGLITALGAELIGREDNVLEYHLAIDSAVEALRAECDPPGLADVFAAFR
ncbi:N-acetyltransferase family protein [Tsuneonella sp. HG094]